MLKFLLFLLLAQLEFQITSDIQATKMILKYLQSFKNDF